MRDITIFILNYWQFVLPIIVILFLIPFIANKIFPNNTFALIIKQASQVFFTNWINLAVIFKSAFLFAFFNSIISVKFTVDEALFGAIYLVLGYGIMCWIGFFIIIALLDVLLFSFNKEPRYTNYKLALEWIIISLPFIYWLIKYNQWIFLVAVFAFFIGQYLRRPYIFKILQ